jgi:hypothetical protein
MKLSCYFRGQNCFTSKSCTIDQAASVALEKVDAFDPLRSDWCRMTRLYCTRTLLQHSAGKGRIYHHRAAPLRDITALIGADHRSWQHSRSNRHHP